jgi:molybdenum cofactor cytidylyltransferase
MVLADQPALTPELLNTLAKRYRATGAAIVLPVYQGRRGNPVLFDRALFADLLAVEGDQGGRAILARHASSIERVEVDDPSVLLDIDTRADYDKVGEGGIEP